MVKPQKWQQKLRSDLARGVNRPMFPKQGDTRVNNCDAINCINNKVRVCQLESIDIDTEEDFLIAESILIGKKNKFNFTYHKDVDKLIKDGVIKTN